MKNIVRIFTVIFAVALFTGCYDRDIIDSKEFNYSLPPIENLNYTKQGNTVKLTWQIPSNISDDFVRPLEVSIQVVENYNNWTPFTLSEEVSSGELTVADGKQYKVVVRLLGYLKGEIREKATSEKILISERVYSEGKILEIK